MNFISVPLRGVGGRAKKWFPITRNGRNQVMLERGRQLLLSKAYDIVFIAVVMSTLGTSNVVSGTNAHVQRPSSDYHIGYLVLGGSISLLS